MRRFFSESKNSIDVDKFLILIFFTNNLIISMFVVYSKLLKIILINNKQTDMYQKKISLKPLRKEYCHFVGHMNYIKLLVYDVIRQTFGLQSKSSKFSIFTLQHFLKIAIFYNSRLRYFFQFMKIIINTILKKLPVCASVYSRWSISCPETM